MTLRRTSSLTLLLAVAALTAAACGDSSTGPTDPGTTPVEITELFPSEGPGTLTPNGGITHLFVVQQSGSIVVTLTTLTPEGFTVGMGLGTWNGTTCAQTIVSDAATQGTGIVGTATGTGNYCVRVFDAAGSFTGPVEYQLAVSHF